MNQTCISFSNVARIHKYTPRESPIQGDRSGDERSGK